MPAPERAVESRIRRITGVRTVRRPLTGRDGAIDLAYTRTPARGTGTPIVVLPGGPGMASMLTYSPLRAWATNQHIDLLMIDHRGVGLSRTDHAGRDLTHDDMWVRLVVEDVVAVLDAEGIDTAILYGASYGTYLAQAVAAEHPGRVAGLVLDSPMLGAQDVHEERRAARATLWDGTLPATRRVTAKLRTLVGDGTVPLVETQVVARTLYEFAGPDLLEQLLDDVHAGRNRLAWNHVVRLNSAEATDVRRHLMEFDLAGAIAFRELGAAPEPDGLPFDPGATFADVAPGFPAFTGDPYDLLDAAGRAPCPMLVLSGERDLRTPPAVAERIAAAAPHARLIRIPNGGHSQLDTRQDVARIVLEAVARAGVADADLDERAIAERTAHRVPLSLETYLRVLIRAARLLPGQRR